MNANDLTQTIKWLGREVLAQKQAHLRGLNRAQWFTATAHGTNPTPEMHMVDFTITIQFGTEYSTMPLCQVYSSLGDYRFVLNGFAWNSGTRTATFSGYVMGFWEGELDVKAIATEYIQSLSVSIIPWSLE